MYYNSLLRDSLINLKPLQLPQEKTSDVINYGPATPCNRYLWNKVAVEIGFSYISPIFIFIASSNVMFYVVNLL